jgi:hypothetical protein
MPGLPVSSSFDGSRDDFDSLLTTSTFGGKIMYFDLSSQFCPAKSTKLEFARITNNFLRDERLVSAISPKRDWRFTSIEVFFIILFNVPEMPLNTRKIELFEFEVGLGSAVLLLKRFTCITDLLICVTADGTTAERLVDLDAIVRSCSLLHSLDLRMLENYSGTLQNAANLRSLSLGFCKSTSFRRITSSLIPLKSAKTLTSFSINHREPYMDEFPGRKLAVRQSYRIQRQLLNRQSL